MINNKKIAVIMPAYNAEKTLEQTYNELYKDIVDEIILVDDNSSDKTKEVAKKLGITTDRKSTRLNSSHMPKSRMPSSA